MGVELCILIDNWFGLSERQHKMPLVEHSVLVDFVLYDKLLFELRELNYPIKNNFEWQTSMHSQLKLNLKCFLQV